MSFKRMDAYRLYIGLEFLAALIFRVIFTVNLVYQITVVRLEPLQLVLVGTVLELSVFLFEVPTGVVADVFSRRLSIIIGYIMIGAGFLLEGAFPIFSAVLLGQVFWGIGYTFTSGATQAWISDEIGEQAANRAFLRGSQASALGALMGILVSVLVGSLRINYPILLGGGLFLGVAVLLAGFMPEDGYQPTPQPERNSWQHVGLVLKDGLNLVRLRPALAYILLVGVFYGLYSEGYDRLWTRHLLDRFALPAIDGLDPLAWFGIIYAVGAILSMAAIEAARRWLDVSNVHAVRRGLWLITLVLLVGLVGYTWLDSFPAALATIWLIDVSRSMISPLYTAWVNQRLEARLRATILSMSSQVDALGQIAGGPLVGVVGNLGSVRMALSASAALLAPQLALLGLQRAPAVGVGAKAEANDRP